jgi:hypothetical protein
VISGGRLSLILINIFNKQHTATDERLSIQMRCRIVSM